MKKARTAATKQSRNISRQTLTVGLDLGDRNSWHCVLDEAGRIQLEQRVRTNAKALQEVFGAQPIHSCGSCVKQKAAKPNQNRSRKRKDKNQKPSSGDCVNRLGRVPL